MGKLLHFLCGDENRAAKINWNNWGSNFSSYTGREIDDQAAMRVTAIFACVRILAQTAAMLPCITYRKTGKKRERATDHWLYPLLHLRPNNFQTSFQFWRMLIGHLCMRGKFFAQAEKTQRGTVTQLVPLHPDRVTPIWGEENRINFEYRPDKGAMRLLRSDQVIYVPGLSSDPLKPYGPIELLATHADTSLSTTENSAQFFAKSTRPSGALKYPAKIKETTAQKLRSEFERANSGTANAFGTILLEEGLEWQAIGLTNEQSQFIEICKFTVTEIARHFGVPPHLISDLDRATFNNIEHQSIEFVVYSLGPLLKMIEQAVVTTLLPPREWETMYVEFMVDGLLRGDVKTRHEAYASAITNGWMTRNEVREKESLNPADGLDEFLVPNSNAKPGDQGQDQPEDEPQQEQPAQKSVDITPILRDTIMRIMRKEQRMAETAARKNEPANIDGHRQYVTELMTPLFSAVNASAGALRAWVDDFMERAEERLGNPKLDTHTWLYWGEEKFNGVAYEKGT